MPGLLKKEEPTLALTYEVDENVQNARQARNAPPGPVEVNSLNGLLRLAVEATEGVENDADPAPLNLEARTFLENAIRSMTIDVVGILVKQIKTLQEIDDTVVANSDVSDYMIAFDTILEYVDNIDIANDFHKIGGFSIFERCLRCENRKIIARAADLLAELCQNNPHCQEVAVEHDLLSLLMSIMEEETDVDALVKVIYAVSCIVRGWPQAFAKFEELDGYDALLAIMQRREDKLRTKSAFLLNSLCRAKPEVKAKMVGLGTIPILITLLAEDHISSHEHILALLMTLIEDNAQAVEVYTKPEYRLQEILNMNLNFTKDKDECYDECQNYEQLLNELFPNWNC